MAMRSNSLFSGNPFANKKANLKTLVASASKFAILGNKKSDRKKVQQFKAVDKRKAKNMPKQEPKKTALKPAKKAIQKMKVKAVKKVQKKAVIEKRVTRSGRN